MRFKKLFRLLLIIFLVVSVTTLTACNKSEKIVIGEGDWDSNLFHDQVAKFIIEEGYGVECEIVMADTSMLIPALRTGEIDINIETWSDNIVSYDDDIATGYYQELGVLFDDNIQGIYIPQYLKDAHPELVSVKDLLNPEFVEEYIEMFKDPEDTSKGLIYGGPESWDATQFVIKKISEYGLDEFYNFQPIDSTAALNSTLAAAFRNETPWIGYNWEPTWAVGLYDIYLLEDDEFSEEDFSAGRGSFPSVKITVVATKGFTEKYPAITEFLSKIKTSSDLASRGLAYMMENDSTAFDSAMWFLKEYEELWSTWVPADVFDKVKLAIK